MHSIPSSARALLVPSIFAFAFIASTASAETENGPAAPRSLERSHEPESKWYGSQTLLADGVAVGLFAGGVASDSGTGVALSVVGFGSYVLAPPIIHWSHGNVLKGFGSLALRIGLPIAGAQIGCAVAPGAPGGLDDGGGCLGSFMIGMLTGIVVASAFDAGVLAYAKDDDATRDTRAGVSIVPTLSWANRRGTIGLQALF